MTSRFLGWAFTVLSVIIMWQVRLDGSLRAFAKSLGAESGSPIEKAFVDLGVPIVLCVSLLTFNWFYGKIFWRFLNSRSYLQGWWIYSLVAETAEGARDTLGFFHVQHSQENITIDEGQAFWPLESLVLRGNWQSETVWFRDKKMRFVYWMTSGKVSDPGFPADYEGYLELERASHKPIAGKQVWAGRFNDLKLRGLIRGPVYAERMSTLSRLDIDRLKALLIENKSALLERVHEAWPEGRTTAATTC